MENGVAGHAPIRQTRDFCSMVHCQRFFSISLQLAASCEVSYPAWSLTQLEPLSCSLNGRVSRVYWQAKRTMAHLDLEVQQSKTLQATFTKFDAQYRASEFDSSGAERKLATVRTEQRQVYQRCSGSRSPAGQNWCR